MQVKPKIEPTLTEKQKNIYLFIKQYIDKNNLSPTAKEIGSKFKIRRETVDGHLQSMEKKGFIKVFPYIRYRKIKILKDV